MVTLYYLVLGTLKESYWKEAEAEYLKRLKPLVRIETIELREESFGDKDNVDRIREKEAAKIMMALKKIPHPYIIALDERGSEYTSVAFAQFLKKIMDTETSLVFIIGGPRGLDKTITHHARTTIALSKFTFTHHMARIILTEQIYRSLMIIQGRTYHY